LKDTGYRETLVYLPCSSLPMFYSSASRTSAGRLLSRMLPLSRAYLSYELFSLSLSLSLSLTVNRFHAVLAYLYTREIEFGSRDRIGTWFGPCVPSATAKSIYRLADKVLC